MGRMGKGTSEKYRKKDINKGKIKPNIHYTETGGLGKGEGSE